MLLDAELFDPLAEDRLGEEPSEADPTLLAWW